MKSAYPNFSSDSLYTKPVYNLNKWLEAMREIYSKLHFGVPFKESFGSVTSGWDTVETKDFSTWLSYYQSGNQSKYKKAQFYMSDTMPGYLVPNIVQQRQVPPPIVPDFNQIEESARSTATAEQQAKSDKENKRKLMEEQRKKIIGRLHAAIKYLTSYEGHMLAGDEFSQLLNSMYEILKQIQTVNKISISNQLYYDLIIRQSNKLSHSGYVRSSKFLTKFAQNASSKFDHAEGPLPIASQTGNGVAGSLTNDTPSVDALSAPKPPALEEKPAEEDPLDEMLKNLNTGGITDENFSYDDNEIDDEVSLDDDLSVEAQIAPSMPKAPTAPFPAPPMASKPPTPQAMPEEMEVGLSPEAPDDMAPGKDIDVILNDALSGITIRDVIVKLESVISIFRNRQISREITTIDIMLNRLGLASLFPELGECNQKTLESTGYVLSRLEKIISQLNGTISTSKIDLNQENEPNNDIAQNIKNNIVDKQEKDKKSRELRKQLNDEELNQNMGQAPTQQSQLPPGEEISQVPTQLVP